MLRDFRTIIVVLVMPVVLLLLFGFAISTEVNNVRVATVVEQHTDQTKQVIDRFRANPYFTFEGVVAYSDVEDLLREGRVDAAVVFRARDGKLEHQVIVDASNTIMAQTATAYLESVISPGADTPIVTSTLYNPRLKSAYNFVPGIMGMIFILICAMMTSVSIVKEKEMGTMDLLLVSPVRPWTIIFGKLVPYFLLSCVIIWVTILYVILALALGLLISTIASTQVAALLISGVMFMIPVILLSGMIFPVENMPLVLQWFSCVIPARWYISAVRVLMIQRLPVDYVLTEVLVLAGMTLLVLALAIKKFNEKK